MSSVKGGITPLFARRTKPAKVSLVFAKYTGLGAMVSNTENTQALVGIRSNEGKEEE